MSKERWAEWHFRLYHWEDYKRFKSPMKSQQEWIDSLQERLQNSHISAENWMIFEDITSDSPLKTDEEIERILKYGSPHVHYSLPGPTMIQRFVVVREGPDTRLCLGIHTYVDISPFSALTFR
jgi:hypothetical protein